MSENNYLRNISWFFGEKPDQVLKWAIGETTLLMEKLTGINGVFSTNTNSPDIIVGSPCHNSKISNALLPEFADPEKLGQDGYVIRSVTYNGKKVTFIAGNNDRAAMYGLFAFFETLGCKFVFSTDILPETDKEMTVPSLNIIGTTQCPWRGIWIGGSSVTTGIMSVDDYKKMFTQMAKMRMNRAVYYPFENEPCMDYSYAGERRVIGDTTHPESGYMSLGRQDAWSYRVSDMITGSSVIDREYIAPLEFQHIPSSSDALDTGKDYLRKIIALAKERGIGFWFSFDSAFISLNMTKYIRPMPRMHEFYSSLVSFTDPVAHEINHNRIANIVESYPEIEGMLFQITEGHYEDKYPDSQEILGKERPNYEEARTLMREYYGKHWIGDEVQEMAIRADIGFVELMKKSLEAAKAVNPGLRLGILTVCKAYLLTYLDKILPKDMVFVDIESQSLWTHDGAPLHLFKRMEGRECVLVPRAYDDGSMAGLQCNLNLYQRDGFLASRMSNNTSGLVVQILHLTGNDHNVRFLAEGMWREELDPETFYSEYALTLFGESAAPYIVHAFRSLEENEVFLGGRGNKNMPYTFTPQEVSQLFSLMKHTKPFFESAISENKFELFNSRAAKFSQAKKYLSAALNDLYQAVDLCIPSGRKMLDYLINKTEAYINHFDTLILFRDTYRKYADVFSAKNINLNERIDLIRDALESAGKTKQNAIKCAECFASCVMGPSDMTIVWMMNKPIIAARVLEQFLSNLLAFYEGRDYWHPVDWHMLSGKSPFPAYSLDGLDTMVLG